jgi:hypothetical protein
VENIAQLEGERITHSQDVLRGNRQYISAENIRLLAQTKFKQRRKGLTYEDLVDDGPFKCTESEQRARDTLHYHHKKAHLFTSGRTNPQQYFATPDDAEMAAIHREKNTHSHPKGLGILILQMVILPLGKGLHSLTPSNIARCRTFTTPW